MSNVRKAGAVAGKGRMLLLVLIVFRCDVVPSDNFTSPNTAKPSYIRPGDHIKCEPLEGKVGCSCRLSDLGTVVDLSSSIEMEQNRKPRFFALTPLKWYIAWSPCQDFSLFVNTTLGPSDEACIDVGVARFTNLSNKECHGYGRHSTSKIYVGGRDEKNRIKLTLLFRNTSAVPKKGANIKLVCDPEAPYPRLKYTGQAIRSGFQLLEFSSKCCCEDGCVRDPLPPSPHTHAGSEGYIIGGVLGFVALVALIAGVWWRRRRPLPFLVPVVDGHGQAVEHNEHQPLVGAGQQLPQ